MKQKIQILLVLLLIAGAATSQGISPSVNNEYCPGTNITFTVTLPRIKDNTIPTVASWTNTPIIVVGVSNLTNTSAQTTFTFVGKFRDVNIKQEFRVSYITDNDPNAYYVLTFKNIKSFFYGITASQTCLPLQINQTSIQAPRCQITNHAISFSNIKWSVYGETPSYCFGTVTNYEYRLPNGWSIGSNVSNGSNWIAGGNNVTVTSDASNGDGDYIHVRPVNTACGTGFITGQEAVISISRPAAGLIINGSNDLCSGSNNYSVSGLPSGATVTWTATNPSVATLSTSGNSSTLTKSGDGTISLTATAIINGCTAGTTSETVRVGYNYINASVVGESTVYANSGYYYSLSTNPYNLTISNVEWELPSGWTIVYGQGTSFINVWTGSTGGAVEVDFDDACGVRTSRYITVAVGSGGGIGQRMATKKNDDNDAAEKSTTNNEIVTGVTVYPNPAKNNLTIVASNEFINSRIQIIDATGRIMQKSILKANNNSINISKLRKGVYIVQLISDTKIKSLKFVKE
jgi:hypothetical protein